MGPPRLSVDSRDRRNPGCEWEWRLMQAPKVGREERGGDGRWRAAWGLLLNHGLWIRWKPCSEPLTQTWGGHVFLVRKIQCSCKDYGILKLATASRFEAPNAEADKRRVSQMTHFYKQKGCLMYLAHVTWLELISYIDYPSVSVNLQNHKRS